MAGERILLRLILMMQQTIGLSDAIWAVVLERELALSQVCVGGRSTVTIRAASPLTVISLPMGCSPFRGVPSPYRPIIRRKGNLKLGTLSSLSQTKRKKRKKLKKREKKRAKLEFCQTLPLRVNIFFVYVVCHGWLKISYGELSVTLRELFCSLQRAVKTPRLGGEFHNAFRNIIPVTTPIELRRLLMLPRRKERGDTSPKILLNCWVGVVKIPQCSN